MDIQGTKVTLAHGSEPLVVGSYIFQEPVVRLVVKSSHGVESSRPWYIHVDLVDYVMSFCQSRGLSDSDSRAEVMRRYLKALTILDFDPFEAELFWQTYEDARASTGDPYDIPVEL